MNQLYALLAIGGIVAVGYGLYAVVVVLREGGRATKRLGAAVTDGMKSAIARRKNKKLELETAKQEANAAERFATLEAYAFGVIAWVVVAEHPRKSPDRIEAARTMAADPDLRLASERSPYMRTER